MAVRTDLTLPGCSAAAAAAAARTALLGAAGAAAAGGEKRQPSRARPLSAGSVEEVLTSWQAAVRPDRRRQT